jgi:glutaconate CoA-transferase subunit B
MAVMRFDEETKEMYLAGRYPGIKKEEILENMEFEVDVSRAQEVAPPTAGELKILREKCDPQRLIL